MRKVGRTIERIDIPSIVTALIAEPLLLPQHIMRWKLLANALPNQNLRRTIRGCHQIGVTLVLDLQTWWKYCSSSAPASRAMADMVGRKLSGLRSVDDMDLGASGFRPPASGVLTAGLNT
jgi:hypothetical protein